MAILRVTLAASNRVSHCDSLAMIGISVNAVIILHSAPCAIHMSYLHNNDMTPLCIQKAQSHPSHILIIHRPPARVYYYIMATNVPDSAQLPNTGSHVDRKRSRFSANVGPHDGMTERYDIVYKLYVHDPRNSKAVRGLEALQKLVPGIKTTRIIREAEATTRFSIATDHQTIADLDSLEIREVEIKGRHHPVELKCRHLPLGMSKPTCTEGCYLMERGTNPVTNTCGDEDCQGHIYQGEVLQHMSEDRTITKPVKCFGKKGARMVCMKDWKSKATREKEAAELVE